IKIRSDTFHDHPLHLFISLKQTWLSGIRLHMPDKIQLRISLIKITSGTNWSFLKVIAYRKSVNLVMPCKRKNFVGYNLLKAPQDHERYYHDSQPYSYTSHSNRSEEHTSELQSRENIICRLLL